MLTRLFLIFSLALACSVSAARGVYQTKDEFLKDVFTGKVPEAAVLWLTGERKDHVTRILGHPYPSLRIRYWRDNNRSAWILEEVGKDLPITVGLVINQAKLETVRVLTFRESRGWEIRHDFFTDQFRGATLTDEDALDRHIDGISGATLSVRAMKKLAALALYLDSEVHTGNVKKSP